MLKFSELPDAINEYIEDYCNGEDISNLDELDQKKIHLIQELENNGHKVILVGRGFATIERCEEFDEYPDHRYGPPLKINIYPDIQYYNDKPEVIYLTVYRYGLWEINKDYDSENRHYNIEETIYDQFKEKILKIHGSLFDKITLAKYIKRIFEELIPGSYYIDGNYKKYTNKKEKTNEIIKILEDVKNRSINFNFDDYITDGELSIISNEIKNDEEYIKISNNIKNEFDKLINYLEEKKNIFRYKNK